MTKAPTEIRNQVNRGIAWVGAASFAVGMLDIVSVLIILRHWMSPATYGIATAATSLFPVLDLATDLGIASAVIQRDDHSEEKISTVFWLNVMVSGFIFVVLATLAPLLGRFQGHEIVGTLLLAYGVKLIWQNVYFIPSALMKRELRFKELSLIRIVANVAEAIGKIGFAWAGFGVWALVLGPLCRVLVTGIGTQLCHPWRPRLIFRPREAADYARFGLKTSASQILFHLYSNADYQIVFKVFGAEAQGLYYMAYNIVLEPVRIISNVVVDVAFPAFARLKHQKDKLVDQFLSFSRLNLVIVLPFLAVLVLSAEDFLSVVVGASYLPAATTLRVLCIVGLLRALSFVVPPLLNGVGRPTLTLVYTFVASLVLPSLFVGFAIFLGPSMSYLSVALAWAAGYPVAFAVLIWLALANVELDAVTYLQRTLGIPACTVAAMGLAALARLAVSAQAPALRLAVTTGVLLGVLGVLLAYLQGISPRSVAQALEGKPSKTAEESAAGPASS
jgi:O-antigen/teichoic acid export membrane protein